MNMRISDLALADRIRFGLTTNSSNLAQIEQQLSTGQRINLPSDDPNGAALSLQYAAGIAADARYNSTAQTAQSHLSAAGSALSSLTNVLQRTRELAVQAGNGTLTQTDFNSIATELNQLLQQAVQLGNANQAGQYLFAGAKTTAPPFSVSGANPETVAYAGDDSAVSVVVGATTNVRVDVPGDQAFTPTMNAIIQLRDSLQSGGSSAAVTSALNTIDAALAGLSNASADLGARQDTLTQVAASLTSDSTRLTSLQSQTENTDITSASVQLAQAQNVYSASLSVASRALSLSLANFLGSTGAA